MTRSFLRLQLIRWYGRILARRMRRLDQHDLSQPALVFAPHQDDETLGCGGTILKKTEVGAHVDVVFMTDGSTPTRGLISPAELRSLRREEALAACQMLGVGIESVIFLEFESKRLAANAEAAGVRVLEILRSRQPAQVFFPYCKDEHADHLAASTIVSSALGRYEKQIADFQYPVWFWHHWPWTSTKLRPYRRCLSFAKRSALSVPSLIRDFRHCVYVGDVLDHKRAALDQHASQMTRLVPTPRWRTLNDVSEGEFLECFFQDCEIFHRSAQ